MATTKKATKKKSAASAGTDFEKKVEEYFHKFFAELGYIVVEIRRQKSGSQNGFDIRVRILDKYNNERNLYFESKFYESVLDWTEIATKIIQLDATNYEVDGFIALSPKVDISNISDHIYHPFCKKYKFPIKLWTPHGMVHEMFCLDHAFYEEIYKKKPDGLDSKVILNKYKILIDQILAQKDLMGNCYTIAIEEAKTLPVEPTDLKTTLDEKLNSVLSADDPRRIQYHQIRCDYKIYLEKLQDINNPLRLKIESWENDLRLKAQRLTGQFNIDPDYNAEKFFYDFFNTADESLSSFFKNNTLDGDQEKLLSGVIFELAAKCPLSWVKKDAVVVN